MDVQIKARVRPPDLPLQSYLGWSSFVAVSRILSMPAPFLITTANNWAACPGPFRLTVQKEVDAALAIFASVAEGSAEATAAVVRLRALLQPADTPAEASRSEADANPSESLSPDTTRCRVLFERLSVAWTERAKARPPAHALVKPVCDSTANCDLLRW